LVNVPLTFHLSQGWLSGALQVDKHDAKVTTPAPCTTTETGPRVPSRLLVTKLSVPAFNWRETFSSPATSTPFLRYAIEPPSLASWNYHCPARPSPGPGIPGFPESNTPFTTTWSGLYTLFHRDEVDASGVFSVHLNLESGGLFYASKEYQRTPLPFHAESTILGLLFKPQ
jgi:hypothetical protein